MGSYARTDVCTKVRFFVGSLAVSLGYGSWFLHVLLQLASTNIVAVSRSNVEFGGKLKRFKPEVILVISNILINYRQTTSKGVDPNHVGKTSKALFAVLHIGDTSIGHSEEIDIT